MLVPLRVYAHGSDDVVRGHDDAVNVHGNDVHLRKAAAHQLGQCMAALLHELARHRAFGDADFLSAAVHDPGVLARADVAHQDVGNAPLQIAIACQRGIGGHGDLAMGIAQPGALQPHLGLSNGH